ncbi:MAG: hypothetical protein IJA58_09515 [Lachnospiraceae bacterium]|nr:hypothetical protein [Lachnospiraceae bacterium]
MNAWLLFLGSDDPEEAEKDRALAKQREECEAALLRIAQMERDMERRSL